MTIQTKYEISRALVIAINDYKNVSPLEYAINDAEAFADSLEKLFDFEKKNIKVILGKNATKKTS